MTTQKIFTRESWSMVNPWWLAVLAVWCLVLCFVPNPRPLGAPDWVVRGLQSIVGSSEPESRALATILLRGGGLVLIGVFLALSLTRFPLSIRLAVVVVAPIMGMICQWINYGHFPRSLQLQLGIASTVMGAWFGLALGRSRIAMIMVALLGAGLFLWGSATGISNDLADDARVTCEYLLDQSEIVPQGEEGFAELMRLAFLFAEDNSLGTDAIHPNKAAILALGVIVGEERVAAVAKRRVEVRRPQELASLRNRITLHGRHDLPRHFWVSAALTVLSDEHRSMTVGIGKELMDATPGGSGFSFVDLVADRAGVSFALAATKSDAAASTMQRRMGQGVASSDFFPSIDGLPEGITGEVFQAEYGGLGGKETQRLIGEIERRVAACQGFQTAN